MPNTDLEQPQLSGLSVTDNFIKFTFVFLSMEQAIDLNALYKELKHIEARMVTKEQLESALETLAILSNKETMKQLRGSEEDIVAGRVKKIKSGRDL